MKKIYTVLLFLALMASFLPGCAKKKPTAADSVEAIYNLYILRDSSLASKLGMSEKERNDALAAYDEALVKVIRSNYSQSGLEIDEETISIICQARKEAFSRMEADFEVTSEEEDTSVVTLTTTYFNEVELDTKAFYDAKDAADAAALADFDEYVNYIMDTYTQNLIREYENVLPSEDTKSISVTCVILDNVWIPKDIGSFYENLGLAITGQH